MKIHHPVHRGNKSLWLDPEVEEFVSILNNGHAVLGWEGDPYLGLFRLPDKRWEIARLENGRYNTVCISKPGAKLDLSIISHLMEHDLQRKTAQQLFDAVDKANVEAQRALDAKSYETIGQAVERVYWGAKKDIKGTIYG